MFLGGTYIPWRGPAAFQLAEEYVKKLTECLRVEADTQAHFLAYDVFCPYLGAYQLIVALFECRFALITNGGSMIFFFVFIFFFKIIIIYIIIISYVCYSCYVCYVLLTFVTFVIGVIVF